MEDSRIEVLNAQLDAARASRDQFWRERGEFEDALEQKTVECEALTTALAERDLTLADVRKRLDRLVSGV